MCVCFMSMASVDTCKVISTSSIITHTHDLKANITKDEGTHAMMRRTSSLIACAALSSSYSPRSAASATDLERVLRHFEEHAKAQEASMNALQSDMRDLGTSIKADMRALAASIKADMQASCRMNERFIRLSCVAWFLTFVFACTSQQSIQTDADRADLRSQLKAEMLSSAM